MEDTRKFGKGAAHEEETPRRCGSGSASMMEERDEKYRRARGRVQALKGFYTHLITYVAVMAFLFIIGVASGAGWWFYWPLLGWGIGVSVHALNVYGRGGLFGPEWEERKIHEMMDKE